MQPTATRDEIRVAYRNMARRHHPDAKGDASAVAMSRINEAWRVLSDPSRRAVYDARIDASAGGSATGSAPSSPSRSAGTYTSPPPVVSTYHQPARFPWRFMLVIGCLGIGFVLVNAAFTKPGQPAKPDNLIEAGSCVNIADNGDAIEVQCNGLNQGVVDSLIPFDAVCGQGTESHRDRQGMGQVCVRLASSG